MKSSHFLFSLVLGLMTISRLNSEAATVSVATPNFFNGTTVNASSNYGGFSTGTPLVTYASADPSVLVDQTAAPGFETAEYGPIEEINYFSFSGATTTSIINQIIIFDLPAMAASPNGPREASAVTIYYLTGSTGSLSIPQLLDPTNYMQLGSYALTFSNVTSGVINQDANGNNLNYEVLNLTSSLVIPVGATSVLLGFTKSVANGNIYGPPNNYYHGIGLSEIQAFAAVPEPSTCALIFGGLALVGIRSRRRSAR